MTRRGRRSAAAAAVAVFLLCDVIGSALGKKCYDNGCCTASDDIVYGTRWTCSFSKPSVRFHLRSASTLEDVEITQGHKVVIEGNALATNNNLRSLLFSDIQELILEANSKVQVGADRAVSLTVRRVGTLLIKTSAFLGWESALANVSISDVESVHIDQDAFPTTSNFQRVRLFNITSLELETGAIRGTIDQLELVNFRSLLLRLSTISGTVGKLELVSIHSLQLMHSAINGTVGQLELNNIHSLQLRSAAISGTVKTLSLRNVTAESCPSFAISGSIQFVSLHSVTLSSLEPHCLNAGSRWQRLTLTDSRLGYLSPRSIHGKIANITISGCEITSAGPTAMSVTVGRLNLTTSAFGELGPRALQVRATSSVALRRVSVTHLRPDALSGLRITDTNGGGGGISVSRLSVDHAEPGSLRFADGAPVTLEDLLLPRGCICSTPSWARQLLLDPSGGGEDGPSGDEGGPSSDGEDGPSGGGRDGLSSGSGLATERDTLLRQVDAGLCTVGGDNISLSDYTAQYCGGTGDVSGQPAGRSAPLAGWWSYLGVVALAALLLAVTVLLVIAAVKNRRHRQKKQPERPEPAGAAGGLCSAGGPADVGEQHGASPFCHPVLPSGPAEPQVLFSEVAARLPDEGRPDIEVDSGRAGAEPGNQTGQITAECSEDLPDYAEISPRQCSEDLPDYAEISPRQCSEDLPDYAEISLGPPADPTGRVTFTRMVDNELYGSAV